MTLTSHRGLSYAKSLDRALDIEAVMPSENLHPHRHRSKITHGSVSGKTLTLVIPIGDRGKEML